MANDESERITLPSGRGAVNGRIVDLSQRMQAAELRITVLERCVAGLLGVLCLTALIGLYQWRWPWP